MAEDLRIRVARRVVGNMAKSFWSTQEFGLSPKSKRGNTEDFVGKGHDSICNSNLSCYCGEEHLYVD